MYVARGVSIRSVLLLVALFAGLTSVAGASVLIGTPADFPGNCAPFGCTLGPSTRYQQVYDSASFSGPINITGITFFHTVSNDSGILNSGTYTVRLSTTSKAVNALDLVTYDNNLGADNTQVFSGSLPPSVPFGGSLTLSSSGFLYDPSLGNLLMDILISNAQRSTPVMYMDARNGTAGTLFSRATDVATGSDSFGLVTQFETDTAIPEPSTAGLLLAGLTAVWALRRKH